MPKKKAAPAFVTTAECRCGRCSISFNRAPHLRLLCCCVDCRRGVEWADETAPVRRALLVAVVVVLLLLLVPLCRGRSCCACRGCCCGCC